MTDLRLAVKREYFEAIERGDKTEEYRLCNDYWTKRLTPGRYYRNVIITLGYPKKDDKERTLIFPYTGWIREKIIHPHFGPNAVEVFSIQLQEEGPF